MANVIKERVVSVLQDLLQSAEDGDNMLLTEEEFWALRIAIDMLKMAEQKNGNFRGCL